MNILKSWRNTIATLVLLFTIAVSVGYACVRNYGSDYLTAYGNTYTHEISAGRAVSASSFWPTWGHDGVFAQVRIVGYPWQYCGRTSWPSGQWCMDGAHWDEGGSSYNWAYAEIGASDIYGYWDVDGLTFVDNGAEEFRTFGVNAGWRITGVSANECTMEYNGYWDGTECHAISQTSPILVALGKNQNYSLSSEFVYFDLDGDGVVEYLSWTKPDSDVAFLAYDRDGDGQITSGKELFGNFTVEGAPNGFAALSVLSGETSGALGASHPFFQKLLLWTDRNHDGLSEPSELQPASNVLQAIGLGANLHNRKDGIGNHFTWRGWARKHGNGKREDREFSIYDVDFAVAK